MANLYELLQLHGREGDLEMFEVLEQGGCSLRLIRRALETGCNEIDQDDFIFHGTDPDGDDF
ncbi:MAG: hypothetical protein J0665_19830 [Deltaproteobacteria bacterium]|jgi:hypothetical protein|nr:hypothetical protein [Deltaproteobacteria bacterium]